MNRAALQRRSAARRAGRGVSKGDDANTPPAVVKLVRAALGRIVLDPCSNAHSVVKADVNLRLERGDDGLAVDWTRIVAGRGGWYCNCPFSAGQISRWSAKCRAEGVRSSGILLVNVDTSTEWFRLNSRSADARAFPPRISFYENGVERKGNQYSQVLFFWGSRIERFAAACRQLWKDDVEIDVLRGRLRRAA